MSQTIRNTLILSLILITPLRGFCQTLSGNGTGPSLQLPEVSSETSSLTQVMAARPELAPSKGDLASVANGSEQSISVVIYFYVALSSKALEEALDEADKVFRKTGVQVAWTTILRPLELTEATTPKLDPATFVVRILDRAETGKIPRKALGYSIPCGVEESSCMTDILYHRVETLAQTGHGDLSQVLGHVIAHELGHLFLGTNAHSSKGIMQPEWKEGVFRQAAQGRLQFTPEQAAQIRTVVLQRARAKASVRHQASSMSNQKQECQN